MDKFVNFLTAHSEHTADLLYPDNIGIVPENHFVCLYYCNIVHKLSSFVFFIFVFPIRRYSSPPSRRFRDRVCSCSVNTNVYLSLPYDSIFKVLFTSLIQKCGISDFFIPNVLITLYHK